MRIRQPDATKVLSPRHHSQRGWFQQGAWVRDQRLPLPDRPKHLTQKTVLLAIVSCISLFKTIPIPKEVFIRSRQRVLKGLPQVAQAPVGGLEGVLGGVLSSFGYRSRNGSQNSFVRYHVAIANG
jgi:hypothetical protein